jgi:hypothetical protein
MRMLMDNNIVRNYWLALAAMYGVAISIVAIAIWGGAVLGGITFLGMYLYLQRLGRFHQQSKETAA